MRWANRLRIIGSLNVPVLACKRLQVGLNVAFLFQFNSKTLSFQKRVRSQSGCNETSCIPSDNREEGSREEVAIAESFDCTLDVNYQRQNAAKTVDTGGHH